METRPTFPTTHAEVCGNKVCLPPDEVAQIWEYARAVNRYADKATLCVGGK